MQIRYVSVEGKASLGGGPRVQIRLVPVKNKAHRASQSIWERGRSCGPQGIARAQHDGKQCRAQCRRVPGDGK